MVFSSIPAYLDPANWHQQPNSNHHHHHLTGSSSNNNNINNNNNNHSHFLPPPPPLPPSSNPIGGGGNSAGSIRPGSMADRARMANIPLPETQLKCPRCDSTNTKFCYFNNYSLSQPRHFCKTCRRYWTSGGALRNVPVGGGCRRNKRSKGTSSSGASKSPVSSSDHPTGSAGSSGPTNLNNSSTDNNSNNKNNNNNNNMMMGLLNSQIPPLRFMSPFATDMALNYGMGNNYGGGGVGELSNFHQMGNPGGSLFNFQQQQQTASFPFLAGMETSPAGAGLYENSGVEVTGYNQVRPRVAAGMSTSQMASVKMELESQQQQQQQQQHHQNQELNLSGHLLGMNSGNEQHQYWSNGGGGGGGSTTAWTELSGFNSSSSATNNNINNPL